MSENICLAKLLSICVDSCARACRVIRFVHHKRLRAETSALDNSLLSGGVTYKEKNDPRSALTEADGAAQRIIMQCLCYEYGNTLRIIGEEDEEEMEEGNYENMDVFQSYCVPRPTDQPLCISLIPSVDCSEVPLSDVTVYIDPMDGTREFVENRIHNVQCLIGITLCGIPVAGVIGIPFGQNDNFELVYGIHLNQSLGPSVAERISLHPEYQSFLPEYASKPFFPFHKGQKETNSNDDCFDKGAVLRIFTGDSGRIQKNHAIRYLNEWVEESNSKLNSSKKQDSFPFASTTIDLKIKGGCGSKILQTILDDADGAISILPPGNCSWDTAAPTAILFASMKKYGLSGKVTDTFGGELVYHRKGRIVKNDLGVLLSRGDIAVKYHQRLCQKMREDQLILNYALNKYWNHTKFQKELLELHNNESQAVDVIRNEEGHLFTCFEIQKRLEALLSIDQLQILTNSSELLHYTVPEKDVIRNSTDIKCTMHLTWTSKENSTHENNGVKNEVAYEDVKTLIKLPNSIEYQRIKSRNNTHTVIFSL
mmetsp:Transcript_7072/g.10137  ORF Transcript_7072/g.10137 Transcript_7072/m.10137 type:complete len:539 (-) Transcript_7072:263-1879(-)